MEAQRIETQRVLGVILPPFVVRDVAQGLQRDSVIIGKAAIHERAVDPRRFADAKIGALQNGAEHTLGSDRMLAYKIGAARQHAAEILRPGAIDRAVDKNMTDTAGAQLLRFRRGAEKRVQLAVHEQVER